MRGVVIDFVAAAFRHWDETDWEWRHEKRRHWEERALHQGMQCYIATALKHPCPLHDSDECWKGRGKEKVVWTRQCMERWARKRIDDDEVLNLYCDYELGHYHSRSSQSCFQVSSHDQRVC